jgi:hypothetical protein
MTCATPVLILSCMLPRSCYRVGMNLRSSVVTSIYNKALAISVASLSRKTIGEISNLMSVDSSRLQVREGLYGTGSFGSRRLRLCFAMNDPPCFTMLCMSSFVGLNSATSPWLAA